MTTRDADITQPLDRPPIPLPDRPSGRLIGKKRSASAEDGAEPLPTGLKWLADDGKVDKTTAGVWVGGNEVIIPKELGPYTVQGEIARGGMGIVLRGHHTQLDRNVAIKLLRAEVAGDSVSRDRFMREARATAKLRHPGIVAIHDVTSDADRTYLVMDFVEGQSLKEILRRGPIPPQRAAEIMATVCRAVAHAHEHGILHRDLKPDNVLIDGKTRAPLLTDFGLAKVFQTDSDSRAVRKDESGRYVRARPPSGHGELGLTMEGEVMGTPLYMAPEQIDPDLARVGPQTDVYALGAVLYECLTGRPPFDADSIMAIFDAHLTQPPTPPRSLNPLTPSALEGIVLRALQKDPEERFTSAGAMAKELERFLGGAKVTISRPQLQQLPSEPLFSRAHVALVASFALLATAGYFAVNRPGAAAPLDLATQPQPSPVATATAPRPPDGTVRTRVVIDAPGQPLVRKAKPGERSPYRVTKQNVVELAKKGYVDAQHRLGRWILRGELPGTAELGLSWLERAAAANFNNAIVELIVVYKDGLPGVKPDPEQMIRWLRVGAQRKLKNCAVSLGMVLTRDKRPARRKEAIRWLKQAAEERPKDAAVPLAIGSVLFDELEPHDPRQGARYLEQAAKLGSQQAMLALAKAHRFGLGVARSEVKARGWFEQAARAGNTEALFTLGRAYEHGLLGLARSKVKAREHYAQAARKGHALAKARLAGLH